MLVLICIPAAAVFLLVMVWAAIRRWVSFRYFPIPEYIPRLEYYVFFLPAGVAGWGSMMIAHSYLAVNLLVFNLVWPIGLVIAFIIWEILSMLSIAQTGKGSKVAENASLRDFIALGIGYMVGVLAGSYQLIVHTNQPPQIVFSLGKEITKFVLILIASFFFIALSAFIEPRLRKLRKKGKH